MEDGGGEEPPASERSIDRAFDRLVSAGYGTPRYLRRYYSWTAFNRALDASGRRRHDEQRLAWQFAGGDPDEWPEYEGSEEEQDTDDLIAEIEADLARNPLVRRIGYEA